MTKICHTCKVPKELSEFARELRKPDGRKSECKTCKQERDSKRNSEKKKEREMFF